MLTRIRRKQGLRKLVVHLVALALLLHPVSFATAAYTDVSLSYDDNGNLIQDADYYYEYNGFNNLVRVREESSDGRVKTEYVYGPDGNRVKKSVNKSDGWEYTYYVGDIVRLVNSSGTFDIVYVHDNQGTLLARQDDDGKKYYYHPDHLGSTRIITNQSGDVVEEIEYLPFGADLTNSSQKFTFTGQESDLESDLLYYGARYHSPYLRQFTQPDTIIVSIFNPQNLNRYAYTLNNPVKYTDPTGNYISPLDALDYVSWVDSAKDFYNKPGWGTGGMLLLDSIFVAIPGAGGAGAAVKAGNRADDAYDVLTKTDDVAEAARYFFSQADELGNPSTIRKILSRNPINYRYAGKTFKLSGDLASKYPDGVRFSKAGFPDFSKYASKTVKLDGLTGVRATDAHMANLAAGLKETPMGYTWHHVEDGLTMQLVPTDLHRAVRHTGGAAVKRSQKYSWLPVD